ncbi:hypothetical protein [Oceanicoccus sp. KOV_DT_Chl]|uniref:hypothetical protein n=1 Tax=Oceanicoccus sp. KOV_DT_Chl TaxID=1904639 RepID=UPI000C7D9575|nr:hypothetical protein [Oceanicoccus sp. KOV_DT_Chl]
MSKKLITSLVLMLSLTAYSSLIAAATSEEQKYIGIFSGKAWPIQKDALNDLQWSGLSSVAIYDVIENNLQTVYPTASSKAEIEQASWYAKVLGASGDDKYSTTLKGILNSGANKKVKKYASKGLDNIQKYQQWNPIIRDKSSYNPKYSQKINGFANMIKSQDWELKRIAAKRIHFEHLYDEFLLDAVEAEVKALYKDNYSDKTEIDCMAWLTKAIAGSGNTKYKDTVSMVANEAGNRKVKKYASKYLRDYY